MRKPELSDFFNKEPFSDIKLASEKKQLMFDSGFISNVSMRFWRLLQIRKMIGEKVSDTDHCDFLLELFLNQCLSCTDIVASFANHFLQLDLRNRSLSFHGEKFYSTITDNISAYTKFTSIEELHLWVKNILYPYRNFVHHNGDARGCVRVDERTLKVIDCYVLDDQHWNFSEIRSQMEGHPSHTASEVVNNKMKLPNILTGDKGDTNKFISISTFSSRWVDKVYELIETMFGAVVWFQQK